MRTRIKVADLSLAQWSWLNLNLPETREFGEGDVRMCVELELTSEQSPIHVEMPPREFVVLIERLAQVEEGRQLLTDAPSGNWGKPLPAPDPDLADRLANEVYER